MGVVHVTSSQQTYSTPHCVLRAGACQVTHPGGRTTIYIVVTPAHPFLFTPKRSKLHINELDLSKLATDDESTIACWG